MKQTNTATRGQNKIKSYLDDEENRTHTSDKIKEKHKRKIISMWEPPLIKMKREKNNAETKKMVISNGLRSSR